MLEVWGDLACFSQPALSVERYSYATITPSAARGIFDAIYLKPNAFRWQIDRIELLAAPAYIALRRNEVKEKTNTNAVVAWIDGKKPPEPIWADATADSKGRTQRQTMALKNVRYRLHAHIVPWADENGSRNAYDAQFVRRARRGKCIYQPYLGCREFPAFFTLLEGSDLDKGQPVPMDLDLGMMLYDVFDLSRPGSAHDRPSISLFHGRIQAGVLAVPPYESAAVHRLPAEPG